MINLRSLQTGEMEVKNPLFNDETPVAAGPDDGASDAPQ